MLNDLPPIPHGTARLDDIIAHIKEIGLSEARLRKYRSIMDSIHAGGNIYYDKGRMIAYGFIAKIASEERIKRHGKM
jgi:hypothetical protein